MGFYGSAPEAPDPQKTAAAQTSSNVSTAIANSWLGNVNQVTPDGSLIYSQTGNQFINDANGQKYWVDSKGNYTTVNPYAGASTAQPSSQPAPSSSYRDNNGLFGNAGSAGTVGRGSSASSTLPGGASSAGNWTEVNGYYVPTFTATQTLSPAQQKIKDQSDRAELNFATLAADQSGRLNGILNKPMTLAGAPAAGKTPNFVKMWEGPQLQTDLGDAGEITRTYGDEAGYAKARDSVENALMARMQPGLTQNRQAVEQQLRDRGLSPGSAAWDRAYDSVTRQENDARYGAILNAGQEQNRLAQLDQQRAAFENAAQNQQYQQNLASAQFGNTSLQQMNDNAYRRLITNNDIRAREFDTQNAARANYLNEAYNLRNQNINEVLGLASGAQVSSPNFVPTQSGRIAGTDVAGIINSDYQNRLAAYQQSQSGIGSILGGLGGLFSLSDEDAKKDIKKIGGLYEYRYKGEPKSAPKRIGVMAGEVEKVRPNAVRKGADGFKRVNYGDLFSAGAA